MGLVGSKNTTSLEEKQKARNDELLANKPNFNAWFMSVIRITLSIAVYCWLGASWNFVTREDEIQGGINFFGPPYCCPGLAVEMKKIVNANMGGGGKQNGGSQNSENAMNRFNKLFDLSEFAFPYNNTMITQTGIIPNYINWLMTCVAGSWFSSRLVLYYFRNLFAERYTGFLLGPIVANFLAMNSIWFAAFGVFSTGILKSSVYLYPFVGAEGGWKAGFFKLMLPCCLGIILWMILVFGGMFAVSSIVGPLQAIFMLGYIIIYPLTQKDFLDGGENSMKKFILEKKTFIFIFWLLSITVRSTYCYLGGQFASGSIICFFLLLISKKLFFKTKKE